MKDKSSYTPEEVVNYIRLYSKVQGNGRTILEFVKGTNYEDCPSMMKRLAEELKKGIKEYLGNVPKEIREKISFGFKISDLEKLAKNPSITISSQ